MSRQRFIYPETFQSEDFIALSMGARLLWVGMFTTADDYGRGKASAVSLKALIFPVDRISLAKIEQWRGEVDDRKMARVYRVSVSTYYDIPSWSKYQHPRYVAESKIPPYEEKDETPGGPPGDLTHICGSGGEGSGRVGRGVVGGQRRGTATDPVSDDASLPASEWTGKAFEYFWADYPRKVAKLAALKAFKALLPNGATRKQARDLVSAIVALLDNRLAGEWSKRPGNGTDFPHAATFLRSEDFTE